jgi:hypothetical protein
VNASRQLSFSAVGSVWLPVKDGDDTARAIFDCHYSRYVYRDGRKPLLFVGPGEKLVLVTPDALAVFAWRKFKSKDSQVGVNCAIFRNEGAGLSSDLIRRADALAWDRWPAERRHYTYVNASAIRPKRDPGRCFLRAGWRYVTDDRGQRVRTKKRGYFILELLGPA